MIARRRHRDRRRRGDGAGDRLQPGERSRRSGGKRIVVVDGHYLAWGASGRNGGGVRQQWSTEMNVRLMQESMEICAHFAKRMRINVWMRRGGYLFLARTQAAARRLERNVAVQNRCGLGTQMIAPEEARALVPELDTAANRRRLLQPDRRHRLSVAVPVGLRARGREAAASTIHTKTPVTAIERRGGKAGGGFRIETPAGTLHRRADCLRGRRLVAGGRAAGGRVAAQSPAAPRDPVDRAAEAVPETDGDGARDAASTCRSRCGASWSGGITLPDEAGRRAGRSASARGWPSRPRWRARWSS